MSKRNYNNYDYYLQEPLINKVKANKISEIPKSTLKLNKLQKINNKIYYKDNLYYSIERKSKIQKNKIPTSLTKKNIKKPIEINANNIIRYTNRDTFKKTINTYSNENQTKDFNIFEELQNNKYLRPMLGSSNINNKLFKCQIDKNISVSSLKKYFSNNLDFNSEKYKSPQKRNNDLSCENKINEYSLNNRTAMERFNLNSNNDYSSKNEISLNGENKTNNSFAYNDESFKLNNSLLKYYSKNKIKLINNVKKQQKKKYFYSEEREERKDKQKSDNNNNKTKDEIKIVYYNNVIGASSHINNSPIKLKNKNINDVYISKNNLKLKNKNNSKEYQLLKIYKSKLIEEFIIVLNKFISKYLNKNRKHFFSNLAKYKYHSKNKVYFKKKNMFIKKKLSLNKIIINDKKMNTIFNLDKEKDKDKDKNKNKQTTDTSTNFNIHNKSFSNEIKSSSLSNNYLSNLFIYNNNNKLINQSSSSLITEQKNKNYSQSHTSSLSKYANNKVKAKSMIFKNEKLTPPNRIDRISKTKGFVYKKKNFNNDNIYINKINNIDINNFYSNLNNKYLNTINDKKKGKIIDIDINLGKPINIINDHSPLEAFLLEKNEPFLFKLNTISSKFMNKNNKKNKAKSNSKKKMKPPIGLKRFEEEDENEENFYNNIYNGGYKAQSTLKKKYNSMNLDFKNKIKKINIQNKFKEDKITVNDINKENIIQGDKYYIRTNSYLFLDNKNRNKQYKFLNIERNISISLLNDKKSEKNKKGNITLEKSDSKKKVNKLYINCTKFLVKILNRLIKRKIFVIINLLKK